MYPSYRYRRLGFIGSSSSISLINPSLSSFNRDGRSFRRSSRLGFHLSRPIARPIARPSVGPTVRHVFVRSVLHPSVAPSVSPSVGPSVGISSVGPVGRRPPVRHCLRGSILLVRKTSTKSSKTNLKLTRAFYFGESDRCSSRFARLARFACLIASLD